MRPNLACAPTSHGCNVAAAAGDCDCAVAESSAARLRGDSGVTDSAVASTAVAVEIGYVDGFGGTIAAAGSASSPVASHCRATRRSSCRFGAWRG